MAFLTDAFNIILVILQDLYERGLKQIDEKQYADLVDAILRFSPVTLLDYDLFFIHPWHFSFPLFSGVASSRVSYGITSSRCLVFG